MRKTRVLSKIKSVVKDYIYYIGAFELEIPKNDFDLIVNSNIYCRININSIRDIFILAESIISITKDYILVAADDTTEFRIVMPDLITLDDYFWENLEKAKGHEKTNSIRLTYELNY